MKILHLADLHLGKKLNDYSLILDQEFVLKQALEIVSDKKISAVLISGDVFDRAVPSSFALDLFGKFLFELIKLKVKCYIIAGNHDNIDRLSYLSSIIESADIYISKPFSGNLQCYSLSDDIDIYLMPYLYPQIIRKYYPDIKISDYNDGIKKVLDDIELNKNKVNILLAHQFVAFDNLIHSDSEQKSVGGVDCVSPEIFNRFDYVALGHLHCPQRVYSDKIRYAGSILKYSFSEINQKKVFTVLDVSDKNIEFEFYDIKFLHEMKEYKGYFSEFTDENFYSKINTDDFIHFILLDENIVDAKKKLSKIYPNIMLLEFDNTFTRNLNAEFNSDICTKKSIYEHFSDFYKLQCADELDNVKNEIVINAIDNTKEINCAL